MIRIAIASIALLLSSAAFAGELSHKTTYTAQTLDERGIASMAALIDDYAKAEKLALKAGRPAVFLVEGKYSQLSPEERDRAIAEAKSIELMSDGEAVVLNVSR